MKVNLMLNVNPKPLSRARSGNGRMYYTQAKQDEMTELSWAIMEAIEIGCINKQLLKCSVEQSKKIEVEMVFGMRIPDSLSKKKRDEMIGKFHTQKPDLDNLIKNILDRGDGILWSDDKHIHTIRAIKVWSEWGYIKLGINYE